MVKKIVNKQKTVKWVLISIALILVVVITLTIVNAQKQGWKLEVTPNKTEVEAGEEIELSMSIKDINMGDLRYKRGRICTRIRR